MRLFWGGKKKKICNAEMLDGKAITFVTIWIKMHLSTSHTQMKYKQ